MAMIKCKDCGKQVSKAAKTCPSCGAPVKGRASWPMIIMAFIVLFWVLGQMFGQHG